MEHTPARFDESDADERVADGIHRMLVAEESAATIPAGLIARIQARVRSHRAVNHVTSDQRLIAWAVAFTVLGFAAPPAQMILAAGIAGLYAALSARHSGEAR